VERNKGHAEDSQTGMIRWGIRSRHQRIASEHVAERVALARPMQASEKTDHLIFSILWGVCVAG
jgi:hypothetical protein